jgi:hypothetical protein
MPAANQKMKGSGNGPIMLCRVQLLYAVAGCHCAFFNHAEIATATATVYDCA